MKVQKLEEALFFAMQFRMLSSGYPEIFSVSQSSRFPHEEKSHQATTLIFKFDCQSLHISNLLSGKQP